MSDIGYGIPPVPQDISILGVYTEREIRRLRNDMVNFKNEDVTMFGATELDGSLTVFNASEFSDVIIDGSCDISQRLHCWSGVEIDGTSTFGNKVRFNEFTGEIVDTTYLYATCISVDSTAVFGGNTFGVFHYLDSVVYQGDISTSLNQLGTWTAGGAGTIPVAISTAVNGARAFCVLMVINRDAALGDYNYWFSHLNTGVGSADPTQPPGISMARVGANRIAYVAVPTDATGGMYWYTNGNGNFDVSIHLIGYFQ